MGGDPESHSCKPIGKRPPSLAQQGHVALEGQRLLSSELQGQKTSSSALKGQKYLSS